MCIRDSKYTSTMSATTIAITTPPTNPCLYTMRLLPMVPVVDLNSNDVKYDENGVPYIGCDKRGLVNYQAANTIYTHIDIDKFGNTQLELKYSNLDFEDALCGLHLAVHAKYHEDKKELQAHKDLLDHVTFMNKLGDMDAGEIISTQNCIHNKMKDGHNPYYKWCDLTIFPKELMKQLKEELIENDNICIYLRKKYKVWYVCFQKTRFVIMGDNEDELNNCNDELNKELQYIASGKWMDEVTTERYERIKTRIDLELSNIDLIAETWRTTYEEAATILYKEAEDELRREQELCMFALTGENITVPTPIKLDELLRSIKYKIKNTKTKHKIK